MYLYACLCTVIRASVLRMLVMYICYWCPSIGTADLLFDRAF